MEDENNKKVDEEIMFDDVVPEDDSDHARGGEIKNEIVKLKEKLKECEKQKQEYLDSWQRAQADFINVRKRDEEKNKEIIKYSNENLILEIIPVLDSFDIAFGNKESWEKVSKDWRMGVEYIYSQFVTILLNNGVKQLNPIGEKFNPEFHESIGEVSGEGIEEGKIVEIVQKGYLFHNKLIRTAKVKVGISAK